MSAQILKPTSENLALVAHALRQGEVVAIPTETVYGLAGSALNPLALARIFESKERPTFDPLIIHVGLSAKRVAELDRQGLVDSTKLSDSAREIADRLMARFWPGPLTLVLPKKDLVPDLATSGLSTVALRMPRHSIAQALIAATGTPLAAPSANRFGRISPTSAEDVREELRDRIDWILDGGRCEVGVESTILSISEEGKLSLLRPGGLTIEEIEEAMNTSVLRPSPPGVATASPEKNAQLAPGMLESHYAPQKALRLLPSPLADLEELPPECTRNWPENWRVSGTAGLLTVTGSAQKAAEKFRDLTGILPICHSLSESGDLREAARNLFQILRWFDQTNISWIVAEPSRDETGLGYAISDRLRRAAAPRP